MGTTEPYPRGPTAASPGGSPVASQFDGFPIEVGAGDVEWGAMTDLVDTSSDAGLGLGEMALMREGARPLQTPLVSASFMASG